MYLLYWILFREHQFRFVGLYFLSLSYIVNVLHLPGVLKHKNLRASFPEEGYV